MKRGHLIALGTASILTGAVIWDTTNLFVTACALFVLGFISFWALLNH